MKHVYSLQDTQISIQHTNHIQKLYLELSSECNFDCGMCFRHGFSDPVGSMSEETLNRTLAAIKALPELKEAVIGGLGEPLLHSGFKKVAVFIKKRGISVTVTTNGSLMEPYLDFFIEQDIDKIVFSFETGDIGHSLENNLFEIIKKLKEKKAESKKEKPIINILMVITKDNIRDLPHISKMLESSGVKEILLSNLLPSTENHKKLVLYPSPEPAEVKAFKNKLFLNILIERTRCRAPKFEIHTDRYCDFVENKSLVIRWDGEVAPCYRLLHSSREIVLDNEKTTQACSFGNVNNYSLLDIWNNREYTWFRFIVHHSMVPSCIDCQFRTGCEFIESTKRDCWSNENTCSDCLWARGILKCP